MYKEQLEDESTVYIFEHNDGRTHRGTVRSAILYFGSLAFACHNITWRLECKAQNM